MINEIKENLLDFFDAHKTMIAIFFITIIAIIILLIVGAVLYNPIKLTFEGEDSKVIATMPTKLNINGSAIDKNGKKYEIKWSSKGGNVTKDLNGGVIWELPEEEGTYNLIATAGEKKFVKKVSVLKNELTNTIKNENNNFEFPDSDLDGLSDEYENTISKTDPNSNDTDTDGLYDGNEIALGLDPNSEMSKTDNTSDFDRELNYIIEEKENNIKVEINGTGNIVNSTIDKYNTKTIQDLTEVASDNYNIYSEGSIKNAKITISYNKEFLKTKNIDENNLSIYKIKNENNDFEKIGTIVDVSTSNVTADVKELGTFFIADSTKMTDKIKTELMFAIDNSGSMYSSEEIKESKSNDPTFKRVDLSNKLIDKLQGEYKFGALKFTFESSLLSGFTTNKEEIKSKIDSMKTDTESFTGTYIGNSLNTSVKEFPEENTSNRRFIILITDGKDTNNVAGYDDKMLKNAIKYAQDKKIKVYTIGLGLDIDKEILGSISKQTGGEFYYASTADLLDNIFELISSEINYNLLDIDKDNTDETVMLKNSNFVIAKDGYSFENFATKQNLNGYSYGMTLLAKLYYEKTLPKTLSEMSVKKRGAEETVKASGYNLSGSLIDKDSDLIDYKFKKFDFINGESKLLRSDKVFENSLKIKDEYKLKIESNGFLIYDQKYSSSGADFKTYQNYYADLESEIYKKAEKEDTQIINAINRLDILKYKDEEVSFLNTPDLAYSKLTTYLSEGKPVILKVNENYSLLATRLDFDKLNPNKIKIEVYDCNYKSKVKYIDAERIVINEKSESNKNKYNYKFRYNETDVNLVVSIPNIAANL